MLRQRQDRRGRRGLPRLALRGSPRGRGRQPQPAPGPERDASARRRGAARPGRRPARAAQRRQPALLRGRGGAAGRALPPDGRALRPRRPPGGARRLAGGPLRRPPRHGRVRAPGDRRQAGAAGDRAHPRGRPARALRSTWSPSRTTSRSPSVPTSPAGKRSRRPSPRLAARLPDDCLRAGGRRVGVRGAGRGPVRAPGAGRDRLPRALGAGPRLLRAPRAALRARGGAGPRHRRTRASSTRSSPSPRPTSRRWSTTCAPARR